MHAVYLDHAATTPLREEVREAMAPFLAGTFGNPSSLHRWGRAASAALEEARAEVASALGARPGEIHFVRGGTESDNLALAGWWRAQRARGHEPSLAVSAVEHHAVLDTARALAEEGGGRVEELAVSPDGSLDEGALGRLLHGSGRGVGPLLLSVMWVNNETGMVLPVARLADEAGPAGALLHTDAAQALGKVPVDVREAGAALLSATGHKIGGPKGAGLLFVRDGTPLTSLLHGGGQERGLRPGTEDVAGAVGLAAAVRLAVEEQAREAARLRGLRERLERALTGALDGVRVNAGSAPRAPHVLSVGVEGVQDAPALVMALDLEGIAVSAGSACVSGSAEPSHVMRALYGRDDRRAALRFSVGRDTTPEDVDRAAEATVEVVRRARRAAAA